METLVEAFIKVPRLASLLRAPRRWRPSRIRPGAALDPRGKQGRRVRRAVKELSERGGAAKDKPFKVLSRAT